MSNIARAFANGKAFIPFVTCGDPDLETTAKVVRAMAQAGADLICKRYGVNLISMAAPTSENRIAMIAREAAGFLYIVSSLGVTGVRSEITTDIGAIVRLVRESTSIPCAVGFGISTPEQARNMAGLSDGAIVGSAIVKLIARYGRDAAPHVAAYVKEMKDAVRLA